MKRKWLSKAIVGMMLTSMSLGLVACGNIRMIASDIAKPSNSNNGVANSRADGDVVEKETSQKLEKIEDIIDSNFYFEDDDAAKQDGIIKGYMESLDDPYSVYYTAEEYKTFMEDTEGEYVGIGFQVSQNVDTKVITTVKVFDGPAKEAGIIENDVVTKVDGEDISEQDIDTVVDKIRGVEGTEVTVTIYRPSEAKEYDFTMKRKKVENPTVEYKMLDNNIGYVSVSSFYEVTGNQYINAVKELESQGMEGLIVDLRNNGGGLINIAVDMLDFMLPAGKIVYTADKDGNITSEYNSTDDEQFTKPLAVLVNGYSASASEIFAGAIKDYELGTLVGTTTYGKGIVQRLFPLEDGSAVKLTIAKYFTPKGNDIHKVGIEPDVEAELDAQAYKDSDGEKDSQLDAAIDVILEKLGKKSASAKVQAETDTSEEE